MTKIKIYITLTLMLIAILFIVCLIDISNKYDDELGNLRKENEKLKKDIRERNLAIESLLDRVECDCDCDWLRSFYDEFHEQVGAFE